VFKIAVDVNPALLLQKLDGGEKRLAFAVANAIRSTALDVQNDERAHAQATFTLRGGRGSDFVLRNVAVITQFPKATGNIPYAEIAVGQKDRLLLSTFEEGGDRLPFKGRASVAVPAIGGPARPSFGDAVPSAYRFGALRLRITPRAESQGKRRRPRGAAAAGASDPVRFGLQGTYQIPGLGVFKGGGEGRKGIPVYWFVTGERVPRELEFVATAQATADRVFALHLEDEITSTLRRRGLSR
jgi:hypothetical protein